MSNVESESMRTFLAYIVVPTLILIAVFWNWAETGPWYGDHHYEPQPEYHFDGSRK